MLFLWVYLMDFQTAWTWFVWSVSMQEQSMLIFVSKSSWQKAFTLFHSVRLLTLIAIEITLQFGFSIPPSASQIHVAFGYRIITDEEHFRAFPREFVWEWLGSIFIARYLQLKIDASMPMVPQLVSFRAVLRWIMNMIALYVLFSDRNIWNVPSPLNVKVVRSLSSVLAFRNDDVLSCHLSHGTTITSTVGCE